MDRPLQNLLLSLLVVSQTTKQLWDKIFRVTTLTEFFLSIVTNLECNSAPFKYLSQVWKRNPVSEECIVRVKVGIISRCSEILSYMILKKNT